MTSPSIFVGLGSNLGDRLGQIRAALHFLDQAPCQLLRVSSLYETAPVGPPQPHYLNAVAEIVSDLTPLDLLHHLKRFERNQGRLAAIRWSPRLIDLDLLVWGDVMLNSPALTLPHPELTRRAFVLVPLVELAPQLVIPGTGKTSATLLGELEGEVRQGVSLPLGGNFVEGDFKLSE